jgi:predicted site-specific integrase-resolvase
MIIHPDNDKMKNILNIKDLADRTRQATEILEAMLDWSNGKIRTINEKPERLDEIVKDLTKQVQALDNKLDKLA